MSKFRKKRLSPAIAPNDVATSTFSNFFRSDARKAGLGRVILYSVASGGRNRSPPSLGAQHGHSVHKRVENRDFKSSLSACPGMRTRDIHIVELGEGY